MIASVAPVADAVTPASRIVYINGIQTTATKFQDSRRKISKLLRDSTNRAATTKRQFVVEGVYNPMGWYRIAADVQGCNTACQDNFEILSLKADEENFAFAFKEILAPYDLPFRFIDIIAAAQVKHYADSLVRGPNSAVSGGVVTADTMADTKTALDKLAGYMRQYSQVIVVAHSEGNLLANLAWATVAADLGQEARKHVRVVNVANTARFSVSGLNLTHDGDVVLAALAVLPGQMKPNFRRETPDCHLDQVCDLQLAPPTFKQPDDFSCGFNPFGLNPCTHYFTDTYLSGDLIPDQLVDQGVIYTANEIAFADRFEDLVYAAARSLDAEATAPIIYQPANDIGVQDIWTTSVFSYTGLGGGPGGGLNDDRLIVGGWGDLYYSLIAFNLNTLPTTASKVELQLFMPLASAAGTTALYLDRITTFWDWRTQGTGQDRLRLWWIDRPAAEQWIATALPAPIAGQWYAIDITTLYNGWKAGTYPNYGIQLRPVGAGNNTWADFVSSNSADTAHHPRLVITP